MKKSFLVSVAIHTSLLLLLISFSLYLNNKSYAINTVSVYLSAPSSQKAPVTKQSPHPLLQKAPATKKSPHPSLRKAPATKQSRNNLSTKKEIKNTQQSSWIASSQAPRNDAKEQSTPSISARNDSAASILHNLIQNQIKHPTSVNFYGKRKLQVTFTLFPDGHIESIKIAQSSNIVTLDQIALNGLKSLSKTKDAKNLLQKPREFRAPIEFL